MWIEKTKNGYRAVERYKDVLTEKEKRVSVSMDKNTASTRKIAERILIKKIEEKTISASKKVLTMKELLELWKQSVKVKVKASSYQTYVTTANSILKLIPADALVDNLSVKHIRQALAGLDKVSERNNKLHSIKQVLRWGYSNDLVVDVSWLNKLEAEPDMIKMEKLSDKYLESCELNALVDAMEKERFHDLTLFLALTGMRIGEALSLEYTDIDLSKRIISITKTFNSGIHIDLTAKTASSMREIYIQDELLPLCANLVRQASSNRFISKKIFHDCKYITYYTYIKNLSQKCLDKDVTPHTLRHTHVALLAENRISLDVISRRLGHEDSEITKEIYFHVTEKLKQKDYETIEKTSILG